jgi:hypothetical protein
MAAAVIRIFRLDWMPGPFRYNIPHHAVALQTGHHPALRLCLRLRVYRGPGPSRKDFGASDTSQASQANWRHGTWHS